MTHLTDVTKASRVIRAFSTMATEVAEDQTYTPKARKELLGLYSEAMGLPQESLVRLFNILTDAKK